MITKKLLYNAVRTPDGTILHSKHVHDFVSHTDKNGKTYSLDGGNEYQRIVGDALDLEDLSVFDDGTFETRRVNMRWGRNFNSKMKRLPRTEWILICDLSTKHIEAILATQKQHLSPLYRDTFKKELEHRKFQKWVEGDR